MAVTFLMWLKELSESMKVVAVPCDRCGNREDCPNNGLILTIHDQCDSDNDYQSFCEIED